MRTEHSDDQNQVVETLLTRVRAFPWTYGLMAGGLAFVVGFVLFSAVVLATGNTSGSITGILVLIGFIYYSAHNVPANTDLGSLDYLSVVAQPGGPEPTLPIIVYYGIPITVLFLAGIAFVYFYGDRDGDPLDGLFTGVSFAIGYVVIAFLAGFAVQSQTTFGTPARVDQFQIVLYCTLYPLGFSMMGAALLQFGRYARREYA